MPVSVKIPCVIMRGGTSKAVFFNEKDLPEDTAERERIILRAFGSPDSRQIDGLGGANSSTSKVALIKPSERPDADVDYLFGQVGVDMPIVGMSMNCGNISSAVGPYAIDEGLVEAVEPFTVVRIYNVNTKKRIIAKVPVERGKAATAGSYAIHGVPGRGARIDLEFEDPGGAVSGKLLPGGAPKQVIEAMGKRYTVSIVDAANPVVFVRAEEFAELGLAGTELPSEFALLENERELSARFEAIRAGAAVIVGLVKDRRDAAAKSPELPKFCYVSPPRDYVDATGRRIAASDIDLCGRLFSMGKMINAYMGTGAVCTITAANTPGTVVSEIVAERAGNTRPAACLRIGHPFGVMPAFAKVENGGVKSGVIFRTARRLFDGCVYVDDLGL